MAELGETVVGRQVRWFLDAAETVPTDVEIDDHFAPVFMQAVSKQTIRGALEQMPWMATAEVEILSSAEMEVVIALAVKGAVQVHISAEVEPDEPHRITGLAIKAPGPSRTEILDSTPPSDEEVDVVAQRYFTPAMEQVEAGGIIVGVTRAGERHVATFGAAERDLRYEIGSITKTFTGLLLAEMATVGEVALDDPLSKHLPSGVSIPREDDREITLLDLATQSSGLPRLPPKLSDGSDPGDPYAHIDAERMYAELATTTLDSTIGEENSYSNFGFGLLGHALALAGGKPFAELITERICRPLGMDRTSYGDTDVIQGHNHEQAVPRWTGEMFYGAGCRLASTIDDMLTYAEANMDPTSTPLSRAIEDALTPRDRIADRAEQALGWLVFSTEAGPVLFHNGGTGGFRSCLVAHPVSRTAVVALCNNKDDMDPPSFSVLAALIGSAKPSDKENDS